MNTGAKGVPNMLASSKLAPVQQEDQFKERIKVLNYSGLGQPIFLKK